MLERAFTSEAFQEALEILREEGLYFRSVTCRWAFSWQWGGGTAFCPCPGGCGKG